MDTAKVMAAIDALEKKVGPEAYVAVTLCGRHMSGSLYTKGVCGKDSDVAAFHIFVTRGRADDLDALSVVAELEDDWRAETAKRADRIVEKMALEIIRLTAEFGQCTDAALRAKFGPQSSAHFDAAITRANEMADNGPFSVVPMAGANAA